MSFSPVSVTPTDDAGNGTSHTVTLDDNDSSGDLLIMLFCIDGNGQVTSGPSGWTQFTNSPVNNFTNIYTYAYYKKASGSEGSSVSITIDISERACALVFRYSSADVADPDVSAPEMSSGALASSANPDPDTITPSGGNGDYHFIAVAAHDDGTNSITAWPSGYTSVSGANSAFDTGTAIGAGYRDLNGVTSEDPGTFTIDGSEQWVAFTIALMGFVNILYKATVLQGDVDSTVATTFDIEMERDE